MSDRHFLHIAGSEFLKFSKNRQVTSLRQHKRLVGSSRKLLTSLPNYSLLRMHYLVVTICVDLFIIMFSLFAVFVLTLHGCSRTKTIKKSFEVWGSLNTVRDGALRIMPVASFVKFIRAWCGLTEIETICTSTVADDRWTVVLSSTCEDVGNG